MSERYVRPTVAGWLTPTLIAPWISVYGAVTAFAALGVDWGLFGKIAGWAVGMLVGSVWAFVFCLMLMLVDLALLAVRVRTLPAGKRGWGTALAAPLMVFGMPLMLAWSRTLPSVQAAFQPQNTSWVNQAIIVGLR